MDEKSQMTPEWIARVWRDNPCQILDNGNVRTGPVRLGFCNVIERGKPAKDKTEGTFGAVLLFPDPSLIDVSILKAEAGRIVQESMPEALSNPALFAKLNNPFKDQGDFLNLKANPIVPYTGFIPGRLAISANSGNQPPCVDMRMAPIIEKKRCYGGVWAIVTLKPKWFDVGTNKGPTFYLQSVMVVADDTNIGGEGMSNPNDDFKGVKIDQAVNPAAAFGATGHTAAAFGATGHTAAAFGATGHTAGDTGAPVTAASLFG